MEDHEVEATIDMVHQAALAGIDKTVEDWRVHPLFRNEMPEDVNSDSYLATFQNIMYDNESPDSMARHFKELGNEMFRTGKKHWKNAVHWWTEGLKQNPTDKGLKSILHSNRATVYLGQQEYQKAALDAGWAIDLDNGNRKAYLRAAHAYQGMANWDMALGAANAGLEIVDDDEKLRQQLQDVLDEVNKHLGTNSTKIEGYHSSLSASSNFLRSKNVAVSTLKHSWQSNWDIFLQYDEDTEETIWPLAVVFNEVLQIDFVEGLSEGTPMRNILGQIIPGDLKGVPPIPWDQNNQYVFQNCVFYIELNTAESKFGRKVSPGEPKFIEVDAACTLKDIFKQPRYVVPGFPIVYVIVRDSPYHTRLAITHKITPGGVINKL